LIHSPASELVGWSIFFKQRAANGITASVKALRGASSDGRRNPQGKNCLAFAEDQPRVCAGRSRALEVGMSSSAKANAALPSTPASPGSPQHRSPASFPLGVELGKAFIGGLGFGISGCPIKASGGLEPQGQHGRRQRRAGLALKQERAAWVRPPPYAHWLERYRPG
jgi:hypothetical protein